MLEQLKYELNSDSGCAETTDKLFWKEKNDYAQFIDE